MKWLVHWTRLNHSGSDQKLARYKKMSGSSILYAAWQNFMRIFQNYYIYNCCLLKVGSGEVHLLTLKTVKQLTSIMTIIFRRNLHSVSTGMPSEGIHSVPSTNWMVCTGDCNYILMLFDIKQQMCHVKYVENIIAF